MYTNLPRPTIFAHRGASAHAPENTLAAFELAIQQGADAIELDAKLTTDGQVVVIFILAVAATEVSIGLAAIMGVYRRTATVDPAVGPDVLKQGDRQ